MYKFIFYFSCIQFFLFWVEQSNHVHQNIIIPFTKFIAYISAWIVKLFDSQVISHGVVLQQLDTGFSVSIQSGCNGVEAVLILTAVMLAFPSTWKYKLGGIISGFIAIELLNIIRIISLFYLGQWNLEIFKWAHLYIWQTLIMLDVLVIFLLWLKLLPAKQEVKANGITN